jgi:hypothetical protein
MNVPLFEFRDKQPDEVTNIRFVYANHKTDTVPYMDRGATIQKKEWNLPM